MPDLSGLQRELRSVPSRPDTPINDTAAHNGDWYGMECQSAEFPDNDTGMLDGNEDGINLSAWGPYTGLLLGQFTRITLAGGKVLPYLG